MKRLSIRISLLVLLMLAASGPPLSIRQVGAQMNGCFVFTQTGAIAGNVLDSSGTPLNGVEIYVYNTNGDYVRGGIINNDVGAYYFSNLPVGSYLMRFTPPNGDQREWYSRQPDAESATPVVVRYGETTTVNLRLQAGTQINLTVRDPDGSPAPYNLVEVFDRDDQLVARALTDDQGATLVAPGLPPGDYRLFARPAFRSPLLGQYYNNKPTRSAADVITLTAGQSSVPVEMTLDRGAIIHGTVTNAATGAPLTYAKVVISGPDGSDEAEANDQGQYTSAGLPSGTHRVTFRPSASTPTSLAPLERIVTVTAPNPLDGFDAALPLGGAISGFITRPDGAAVQSVRVYATGIGDPTEYRSRPSDSGGLYTITGLPSGQYTVRFAPDSTSYFAAEYYHDRPTATQVDRVAVTAPNTTANINAVLDPLDAQVTFEVTNENGDPITNLDVHVLDSNTRERVAHADKSSDFRVRLNAGSYLLQFQPQGQEGFCPYALEFYDNAGSSANATPLSIPESSTIQFKTIKATLEPGSRISGSVTDATTGKPIKNAHIAVYDAGGVLVATDLVSALPSQPDTNVLGRYRTSPGLPNGSYRVRFEAEGYAPLFYGGAQTLAAAQPVSAGASDVNAALTRGGTISGRVSAADSGEPLERAAVKLYADDGRVVGEALTSLDGGYSFSDTLPSGAYRVGVAPGTTADGIAYFTGYLPVFFGGASSLAEAQAITLVAPQIVTADIVMPSTTTPPPATPLPTPNPTPAPGDQRVYLPLLGR